MSLKPEAASATRVVEADREAILGNCVELIPAADLKPGVRARVEQDLVAL